MIRAQAGVASAVAMAFCTFSPSGSSPEPKQATIRPSRPMTTLLKFHDGSQLRCALTHL